MNRVTSVQPLTALFVGGGVWVCNMESKFDMVTIVHLVGVAAYAAIALDCVAHYDLGFSIYEIRGAAIITAAVIAALIAVDFFGKKLGKAESGDVPPLSCGGPLFTR